MRSWKQWEQGNQAISVLKRVRSQFYVFNRTQFYVFNITREIQNIDEKLARRYSLREKMKRKLANMWLIAVLVLQQAQNLFIYLFMIYSSGHLVSSSIAYIIDHLSPIMAWLDGEQNFKNNILNKLE